MRGRRSMVCVRAVPVAVVLALLASPLGLAQDSTGAKVELVEGYDASEAVAYREVQERYAERMKEIFEGEEDSPYMLIAKPVRPDWRDRIPAIVHVDGSARVQSVREETNPVLYRLLKEFEALTGVPVLINTSFNVKGEPIIETPQDAVSCFLTTGIDHLVLHDTLVSKTAMHKVVTPVMTTFGDVATIVSSTTQDGSRGGS